MNPHTASFMFGTLMFMNATLNDHNGGKTGPDDQVVHVRDVIAGQVLRYRTAREWTQQDLADELSRLADRPIGRVVVTNIEGRLLKVDNNRRVKSVSAEMLILLGLALDVSPIELCTLEDAEGLISIGTYTDQSANWREFLYDGPADPKTRPTYTNLPLRLVAIADRLQRDSGERRLSIAVDLIGIGQQILRGLDVRAEIDNRKGGK